MTECMALIPALAAGGLLGALFFGGLWWTVRNVASTRQPALAVVGSLVLRVGVVLLGFHFVAGSRWDRMLACLLGFVFARVIVMRLIRPARQSLPPARKSSHAS